MMKKTNFKLWGKGGKINAMDDKKGKTKDWKQEKGKGHYREEGMGWKKK